MKVIIVGGVAGGASSAARLRRLDENAEIILLEKGPYISYANCGLPYYIGEVIKEKEKLQVQTPEAMKKRFNIDVRINSEVIEINTKSKYVVIKNLENNRLYKESYDKLILSPGASPIRPNIEGIEDYRVFSIRNIPDTYKIKDYIDQNKPKNAVVIGAGFIGLEMAENLKLRGLNVTVVELSDHVLGPLDYEMASIIHGYLIDNGLKLYLKDGVKKLDPQKDYINVVLNSGITLKTDIVILGIGVKPEIKLAKDAGLEIGSKGGIKVNEFMQTSNPDIYAVGDAIEVKDYINNSDALIPLAGPANKQGRIAADNIAGRKSKYNGTQGTSIVKIFNIIAGTTGNNERQLKAAGVKYKTSIIHPSSHAAYYPESLPMTIKLLFSPEDGKIFGAQIVGFDGVDKRIDVLATAIRAGMTVYDLEELELSYAPPFSSAKDPVNMAGFVASNILKGDMDIFNYNEIENEKNSILIDVRTEMEYNLGHIEGSVNIPLDDLRNRLDEIPKDKNILIYCQVGLRGYLAARILKQHGYDNVKNLSGGYKLYKSAVEKHENNDIDNKTDIKKKEDNMIYKLNIDACGLQCPGPIMQVYNAMKMINDGDIIEIKATDPGFEGDIKSWCESTGNELIDVGWSGKTIVAHIKKVSTKVDNTVRKEINHDKAMVIFSGDLDKAIASFIIANGAASMGRKVTMFFTFWGLNILRKPEKIKVKKDLISKMFGFMMPRGVDKLSLSKMNMGGIGAKMIKSIMKKKNVLSLNDLMKQAMANGVKIVACSMSMDIMGIKKEELIDGIEIGGVASFLRSSDESDTTLFI